MFNLLGQPMPAMALSHRLGPPLLVALLSAGPVQAQIVTDGTVGPKVSLSGGEIKIDADLGTRRGDNLFHSFEKFGIATGQTATFTGPGDIKNVISRVTGGEISNIDGTLASKVGQADLFFLNPAGVLFGPNARLEMPGSFHVSTAHELRFADGARFSALDKGGSGLTVAPPEAFGFLDRPAGRIGVDQSELWLPPGKTLSLVGGDLMIDGGRTGNVRTEDGVVHLVSAAGPGLVRIADGATLVDQRGEVRVAAGRREPASVDVSGPNGGGTIQIRAGRMVVDGAWIAADNNGSRDGIGGIDLEAGAILITGGHVGADAKAAGQAGSVMVTAGTLELRRAGYVSSDTFSSGRAGQVRVQAGKLLVSRDGPFDFTGIRSLTQEGASGSGGEISVVARDLEMREGGIINAGTFSSGQGGLVMVQAGHLLINGAGQFGFTGITNSTLHPAIGDGGETYVTARNLELRDGGAINNSTYGRGNAGKMTIDVTNHLLVTGINTTSFAESRISSRAEGPSRGRSGTVQVTAGMLEIRDGGIVVADSNGTGLAGNVSVHADRLIVTSAIFPRRITRISSRGNTSSQGGGDVEVTARVLELLDGGTITSSSFGPGRAGQVTIKADKLLISGTGASSYRSGIQNTARQFGLAAGTVHITTTELQLRDGGEINTQSSNTATGGPIVITVADTLRLNNAAIRAETASNTGGNVTLAVGRLFDLRNSTVTTSVAGGTGSGGNITITPHLMNPPLMALDNSRIEANALRGSGGNITIQAGQLIRTPNSVIQASSAQSVSGTITITAPNTDVAGSLVVLPETLFDVSSQLREACAARGGRPTSSFNAGGRGGLPPDPGTPLAVNPFRQPLEQQTATGSPTPLTPRPPQAAKPITLSGIPQPVLGSPRLSCRR